MIDTNDHGDEQNVNYEETHLKEYGQPNLNGQNISIQEGESPSRRNIHENTPVNMKGLRMSAGTDVFSKALQNFQMFFDFYSFDWKIDHIHDN